MTTEESSSTQAATSASPNATTRGPGAEAVNPGAASAGVSRNAATAGARPVPKDNLVHSQHSIATAAGELSYTATAGTYVIREEELKDGAYDGNRAKAEVFVVSYVADAADRDSAGDTSASSDDDVEFDSDSTRPGSGGSDRPVTFIFNGGPGSPSLWLHLGLFGPRRIVAGDVGQSLQAPFEITDNAQTLLTHSDLVFIDPLTTGYSRAAEGQDPSKYHGFSGDRDLVAEVIRLWTARNDRWLSPKFIAGESYGTTRAAALAGYLGQRHGMSLNGIILLSAILDFGSADFTPGNDRAYVSYLPTYAAVAHYHGKHPGRTLTEVVAEAREFAETDYAYALLVGNRLGEHERNAVAVRTAELIGLSTDYVKRARLRIEHMHFYAELLREQELTVGRLDGRFTGYPAELNASEAETDPSYTGIQYPYTATANHYLAAELGFRSDLAYEILSGRVFPWSYKEFENASVNSVEDLAYAMRTNPQMKVYIAYGYYDGATPFAAAENVMANLPIPERLHENIVTDYFESGHMMYIRDESRIQQSENIREFIEGCV